MHDQIFNFETYTNFTKFLENFKAVFFEISVKLTTYVIQSEPNNASRCITGCNFVSYAPI